MKLDFTNIVRPALLLVDIQNDFCPGGALAVPKGDEVVSVANELTKIFRSYGWPIFASRDHHPSITRHFNRWPRHCVADTPGAELHPRLDPALDPVFLYKGLGSEDDGYSAFAGLTAWEKSFSDTLTGLKVGALYVMGLATDFCVKFSVLDACAYAKDHEPFKVFVIKEGCRPVNINPDDGEKAFAEMAAAGAIII